MRAHQMENAGGAGGCDVPLEWLVRHDAAQGRYVNPTNACQSFQPHPSTFAFSGFEGAKRHRLCRPSGNPLGLNPAGVLLFRMRAHQMENAGGAGGCDVPLEWLVPHDAAQGRYVNPTNACQSFQPHPSTFAFSGFEGAKRHRLCRPSGNPLGLNPAGVLLFRMRAHQMENAGGAGGCDVPLEWLVPHDAAQGRYVNPTNACQSFQPHPSTFAFSGFEGAKRHRLCRPSGNPLGLNPAGVLLFRMRAHQMENAPWKAGRSVGTSHPLPHRPSLCGSALGPRIRHFPTHTVVGQAFPLGFWCLICSLPDAFADWTIVPQLGQAWVNERTILMINLSHKQQNSMCHLRRHILSHDAACTSHFMDEICRWLCWTGTSYAIERACVKNPGHMHSFFWNQPEKNSICWDQEVLKS